MALRRPTRTTAIAALLAGTALVHCASPATPPEPKEPAPAPAPAALQTVSDDGDESIADFYEALSLFGDWVEDGRHGNAWVPAVEIVHEGFVPYLSGGAWVATDTGWVFQSRWDKEWGWATFHYGRWYEDETHGWIWVPDVVWGPAWVAFRYGGAHVGWAPLPPPDVTLAPSAYVFVETRHLADPSLDTLRIPAKDAGALYAETQPSHELRAHGSARWALGPPASHLAAAGITVQPVHQEVPGPGAIRTQGRIVASRPLAGANLRKKSKPESKPAPATSSHPRRRPR